MQRLSLPILPPFHYPAMILKFLAINVNSSSQIPGVAVPMRALYVILLVALIVGGLISLDFMRAANAAQNLKVESIRLSDLDVDVGWRFKIGIPPVEPVIRRVNLRLSMLLRNPTDYTLRVRELDYKLRLNGRQVASGSMEDIYIPPGERTIDLPVSIDPQEAVSVALEAITSAIRSGSTSLNFRYEVQGVAKVPLTVLGTEIPGSEIKVPFLKTGSYRYSFGIPSLPSYQRSSQSVAERARGTIIVEKYGWFVGNAFTSSVRPGSTVKAAVLIRARGDVEGTVTLEVKRDLKYLPDSVAARRNFYIDLKDGEKRTLYLEFITESSSTLRGYFMKVYLDGSPIWEMRNSYPPRLLVEAMHVQTAPVVTTVRTSIRRWGTLAVERYGWLMGGRQIYRAPSGSVVTAAVMVRARGGDVEGMVTLEVRKDLRFRPDETAVIRRFPIHLRNGESRILSASFVVDRGITLRGYYIKVYFNGALIWEMGDGYPPRLKAG